MVSCNGGKRRSPKPAPPTPLSSLWAPYTNNDGSGVGSLFPAAGNGLAWALCVSAMPSSKTAFAGAQFIAPEGGRSPHDLKPHRGEPRQKHTVRRPPPPSTRTHFSETRPALSQWGAAARSPPVGAQACRVRSSPASPVVLGSGSQFHQASAQRPLVRSLFVTLRVEQRVSSKSHRGSLRCRSTAYHR